MIYDKKDRIKLRRYKKSCLAFPPGSTGVQVIEKGEQNPKQLKQNYKDKTSLDYNPTWLDHKKIARGSLLVNDSITRQL